jgi:hypothetical protein
MGIMQKLFGRQAVAAAGSKLSGREIIEELIHRYAVALEAHGTSGAMVSDISKLPAPKETLRQVLIALIPIETDPAKREWLKVGYISLAEFQPGVGDRGIALDIKDRPGEDIRAKATRVAEQGDVVTEWMRKSVAEGQALLQELRDKGL